MKSLKLILIVMVLLFGGSVIMSFNPKHNTETHIAFLYDQTDTTVVQDIPRIANYIVGLANIDTMNGKWDAVKVTLSIIGETSTQHTIQVSLDPSEAYWSRNEKNHKARGRKFYTDLREAIFEITKPSAGMAKSYINRNIFYQLSPLSRKSGKRYCIIYSNLIENSRRIRLYAYKDNPEVITTKRDSLVIELGKSYPLQDLAGIKITNIHKAKPIEDELHEVCKNLFKSHWEESGATVELLSDTPQQ